MKVRIPWVGVGRVAKVYPPVWMVPLAVTVVAETPPTPVSGFDPRIRQPVDGMLPLVVGVPPVLKAIPPKPLTTKNPPMFGMIEFLTSTPLKEEVFGMIISPVRVRLCPLAAPMLGVTNVGLVDSTTTPLPVAAVPPPRVVSAAAAVAAPNSSEPVVPAPSAMRASDSVDH